MKSIISFLILGIFLSPVSFSFAQKEFVSSQTIKNLVFEGGGIRGIAYAGALM
jgi:hypothetical protein